MSRVVSRAERLYRARRLLFVSARADAEAGAYLSGTGLRDEVEEALRLGRETSLLMDRLHAAEQAEDAAEGGASKRARGMSDWPVS